MVIARNNGRCKCTARHINAGKRRLEHINTRQVTAIQAYLTQLGTLKRSLSDVYRMLS